MLLSRLPLCFLLLLFLITSVSSEYVTYKDAKQPVAARVKDLMSRMTLEEKIGQMVQIDRTAATAEIMKDYSIGSVLSGGGSTPLPQASAEDWVNMVNDFQKGSLASRLGIPMIYGIDAVHGHNNVYNATIFPHNVGLGATRDPDLVKRIGAATAAESRATGIPYVFAPCIAVCRDPRWGRCYESYSEDHKVVQSMTEIILGLQGDIPSDSRKGVPYVGGKCFNNHGPIPAGMDKNAQTGFVSQIGRGLMNHLTTTCKLHLLCPSRCSAGIDMVMLPLNHTEFIDDLTSLVKSNVISMDRIDDAVGRILLVKFTMGLFDNPLADLSLVNELGSQQAPEIQAITIEGTTILSAIRSAVDPSTEVVYRGTPDAEFVKSNKFDYAIVAVGEAPYAETAGDSMTLTMLNLAQIIKNVCGAVKCVVIIISGRPIWKLPRTWFKTVDQLPMNVGDPHYDPLYPFDLDLKLNQFQPCCQVNLGCVYRRPYIVLIMVLLMIGSYFTG
ncbi:uncharacterized protein LOC116129808 [Pistacia vera]|uniref:uncharacterized protein LOC116129808 n=1 Tax=Pistacia vera TaxID=55513 RepID=UPI001263687C|nr:uncharacterized protein LOC116129808 [Pistacia vera]